MIEFVSLLCSVRFAFCVRSVRFAFCVRSVRFAFCVRSVRFAFCVRSVRPTQTELTNKMDEIEEFYHSFFLGKVSWSEFSNRTSSHGKSLDAERYAKLVKKYWLFFVHVSKQKEEGKVVYLGNELLGPIDYAQMATFYIKIKLLYGEEL